MEKRIKYGTILLLFLIAGLCLYGFFYRWSARQPFLTKAAIYINTRDLIGAYETNERLSDQRYLYKILSVKGVIRQVTKDESANYTVCLESSPDLPVSVSCSLDSLYYNHHSISLKKGDSCKIRGICAGHFTDVTLVQCMIEN